MRIRLTAMQPLIRCYYRQLCAASNCNASSGSKKSLSCFLLGGSQYKPTLKKQAYTFQPGSGVTTAKIEKWVTNDPCVIGVGNERHRKIHSTFNDPLYPSQQAYLNPITFTTSNPSGNTAGLNPVNVAVIDTGVAIHEDLGGSTNSVVASRVDMRTPANQAPVVLNGTTYSCTTPLLPHGTFVAGIIAATQNNALGGIGLASNAQIYAYTVGNCVGENITTTEIANSIFAAVSVPVDVINMSLGGPDDDPVEREAVLEANNAHIVVVVSAGNSNYDLGVYPQYPAVYSANYPGVITVAWGMQNGLQLEQGTGVAGTNGSNYNPTYVNIMAPGDQIISTCFPPYNSGEFNDVTGTGSYNYASASGSSASAPMVTAAVAITIGFLKANGLPYDDAYVASLVTHLGAVAEGPLLSYVANGARLDFAALDKGLLTLGNLGTYTPPISIGALFPERIPRLGFPGFVHHLL